MSSVITLTVPITLIFLVAEELQQMLAAMLNQQWYLLKASLAFHKS